MKTGDGRPAARVDSDDMAIDLPGALDDQQFPSAIFSATLPINSILLWCIHLADDVNKKRRYRSVRRERQAEETRVAILDAARRQFAARGWTATTIASIAREASVAPETVYARFGNKRAIVQALVMAAMRGADPTTPFMEQAERRAMLGETDPPRMVDLFTHDISTLLGRVAPVLAAVRAAAETEAEMHDLYVALHAARRRDLAQFVARLAATGRLRRGLSHEAATRHVWSLCSPELFLLWTGPMGEGPDAYRTWLASALKRLCLQAE